MRPGKSEDEYVFVSRILMFVWMLIGWFFAIPKPGLILDITFIAVAGGLQLVPMTIQMVIPSRRIINKHGAVYGFVIGSILVTLFTVQTVKYYGTPVTYHAALAGLLGLAGNIVVTLIVSALTKPSHREAQVFEEYKKILHS